MFNNFELTDDEFKRFFKLYPRDPMYQYVVALRKHHPETYKKYNREYYSKRYKKDIKFRLQRILRARLKDALKGINKSESTLKLLGCSVEFLKKHLERQFKIGMTWFNYGRKGWVIDHIRPCSSFDLSKPHEQKKCFNYTNLQPLWYQENLRKGSRHINV